MLNNINNLQGLNKVSEALLGGIEDNPQTLMGGTGGIGHTGGGRGGMTLPSLYI